MVAQLISVQFNVILNVLFLLYFLYNLLNQMFISAIRSGDYYMFQDIENEFELDMFATKDYSDEDEDRKSSTERRLSKRLTLGKVN